MILFFNKNKDFISELSKDQLLFAEDEIKLNDQWVAEIGYPFSYNNKDFAYFGYFYDGNFYMYKIIENKNEDGRIYLKGIHIFFDEMQGHVIRDKKPKNKTVQSVCDDVFKEVGWNFVSSVQGLGTANFYHISYLDAFDKILKTWNCEFYLEIKLSGGKISQKNVILKNDISANHGKWFEYTSNLVSVVAEENHSNVFTAFIGRGKGEETESGGFGRKIKFDKIAWSVANGDPVDKPVGQDYVELKEATKLFGYPDGKPRTTVVDFDDEEDRENLLKSTYEYALDNSRPKLLLNAKVYSDEKVEIGEIATIIRDDLDIRYQTKIIKINRNLLNDEKDIEVGDEVQSSIQRIKGLESKQKEQIEEIESRLEQALKNVDIDFNNEDGYNYDLKAGNKYNLPAGYYSFNKPIDENPTKVTYLGAGKVLIADEKGSDGSWKWKTAIDGSGIAGSEILVNSITANKLASDIGQGIDISTNEYIQSIVESNNTLSEDTLNALSELNQSLNGLTSEEDVQKLIDELNSKINLNKLKITQTNGSFTQEYKRIKASIENNKVELEKLTGVIQSGLDENGNTYTDWIGDGENRVRVGSDGIVMLSNNSETLKLKDGRGYMNSLYVEHELGLGNHTARKMGTEFTVFMPIGGQK